MNNVPSQARQAVREAMAAALHVSSDTHDVAVRIAASSSPLAPDVALALVRRGLAQRSSVVGRDAEAILVDAAMLACGHAA